MASWLDKYEDGGEYLGTTNKGFNYNGAWGGPSMQMGGMLQPPMAGAVQTVPMAQMGGYVYPTTFVPQAEMGTSLPGSVGFTYARTQGIPSEGPYGKKTVPSAQNGQEMQFYQQGLDWTPRNISEYGSEIPIAQTGDNIPAYLKRPVSGDIQGRGMPVIQKQIAQSVGKEDEAIRKIMNEQGVNRNTAAILNAQAKVPKSMVSVGPDVRTDYERKVAAEKVKDYDTRMRYMGYDPNMSQAERDRNKKKNERIINNVMVPLEAASLATGVGSIGSNFLRLGASALERQIGKNLVSKGLKNATSYINPIINKADEALAYAQLDPIGIMGNKLNSKLFNPTTAINRANNTITGVNRNLKNSAVETADIILGEDNTKVLANDFINPLPDDILKYIDDNKPPLFIKALGKIVPPGTGIAAPGLAVEVLNQSLSEEDKSKLPEFGRKYLEKMANQVNIDSKLKQKKKGGVVKDDMGYWNPQNWGKVVEIDSPYITMKGVDVDLIGVSDTGDVQYMEPGQDYTFDGTKVREYPVAAQGVSVNKADEYPLKKLDNLLNFTNYNKKAKSGGWLDKYN